MASSVIEATQQIFISYSRRDYYLAESLSLQLVSRGLSAWMDVLELQPGADWERSLFEAIDGCAAFVLVASPAALASPHVRDCANHAEATSDITDCIVNFHNSVRLHSSLGNLLPNSFAHQSLIEQPYRLVRNYSIRTVSGKSAGGNDASAAGTGAWARLWPGQLLPGLGRSCENQQRATAK